MGFDLSNYETVAERQAKWWADHPEGRIVTTLLERDETQVVFRAQLYRNATDEAPYATGHAFEVVSERGVNATSHVENAETSAIGRALAAAGLAGTDPEKRASREEMSKVQRASRGGGSTPPASPAAGASGDPNDPFKDLLLNPNGWWDNRENKRSPRGPDFTAKKDNPHWAEAGEPYKGKPQPMSLWLTRPDGSDNCPPGFHEALLSGDISLCYPEPYPARGKTAEEATAKLAELGAEEVPDPDTEPF